jgi:hypothetical protein
LLYTIVHPTKKVFTGRGCIIYIKGTLKAYQIASQETEFIEFIQDLLAYSWVHFPGHHAFGSLHYLLVMVAIDNLQGKTPYYLEHFPQ